MLIRFCLVFLMMTGFLSVAESGEMPAERVVRWFGDETKSQARAKRRITASCATVGQDGRPSTCLVTIVNADDRGAVFVTHKNSREARQLQRNRFASLHLQLLKTRRQLSIDGKVMQLPRKEGIQYWKAGSRKKRLMFMASDHQSPLESQEFLRERLRELNQQYKGQEIPMPREFVAFRVEPESITFYDGSARDFATKHIALRTDGEWSVRQLQP